MSVIVGPGTPYTWAYPVSQVSPSPSSGALFFTSSASWTVPAGISKPIKVLAVGGGGGGGAGTSSYYGGGGGSGALSFFEMIASAGTEFSITVGAGGAGGTSGNSGNSGGASQLMYNGQTVLQVPGGMGGGAANGADGAGGSGGGVGANANTPQLIYWPTSPPGSPFVIFADYCTVGNNGGSGSSSYYGGQTPALNATLTGTSTALGVGNGLGMSYGNGGSGGYPGGETGTPGVQGFVIIWWGD